jgi:CheY-like chemotaxis protein
MPQQHKVLAVDDSATIRKALELILLPAGYEVEFAVDGAEALAKVKRFQPDIVLLDFILPDMRGNDVCRRLAADPETANIPIVLISARGAEIRQAYNDAANVIDYIAKPFTPEQVIGVLNEVATLAEDRAAGAAKPAAGSGAADSIDVDGDATSAETGAAEAESEDGGWGENSVEVGDEDEPWSDVETDAAAAEAVAGGARREEDRRASQEVMFDTLRAALEGVYVEEADTPTGAAADRAKSYTEVARKLAQQIGETLEQAESGEAFHLCSDGSIRSLSDSLLETHRRVCRLLFRATDGGVVDHAAGAQRPRLLAVFQEDSELADVWRGAAREAGCWQLFTVCSNFRQLPLMTRLYGPTHMVVDVRLGSAAWDQIGIVRSMPEGRRLRTIGVTRPAENGNGAGSDVQALADLGVDLRVASGPGVVDELRAHIFGRPASDEDAAGEATATAESA